MGNMDQSDGSMLVLSILIGSILIGFCLIGQSMAMQPNNADSLSKIKDFHTNFINHAQQSGPSLAQPKFNGMEIFESPASRQECGMKNFPSCHFPQSDPVEENIALNCANSEQQVQKVYAFNSKKQRNIVFDDTQMGDIENESLENSLDIKVEGDGKENSKGEERRDSSDDMGIEDFVDNAVNSQRQDGPIDYASDSGTSGQKRLGNYMDIDVSGISVQAINTVEGGSAVATSNIEIKPVQIINCPPEVEEKLK